MKLKHFNRQNHSYFEVHKFFLPRLEKTCKDQPWHNVDPGVWANLVCKSMFNDHFLVILQWSAKHIKNRNEKEENF